MRNRFVAFLLVVLMIFSMFAFAGCSGNSSGAIEADESRTLITVSLWLPTINEVSAETAAQIEKAVNELTISQYSTYVKLHLIQEDKYDQAIKDKQASIAELPEEVATVETIKWDNGFSISEYPGELANQLDIFVIHGIQDYITNIELGELTSLSSYYEQPAYIKLKEYVNSDLISWAKYSDECVYAITNNCLIGKYKFLLINKNLCDELYYDADTMTSIHSCRDFILDVAKYTDVTPILSKVEPVGVTYFSNNERGLLASQQNYGIGNESQASIKSFLSFSEIRYTIGDMKLYSENNYFAEDPATCEEFGVAVIEGDYDIVEKYSDDYFVKIYEAPMLDNDDVYGAMMGISQYTVDVSRTLEILSMINTNSNLRTILQYGIQGVHWDYADETQETIQQLSQDYLMNLRDTGNTFITYPDYGVSMDYWEYAKHASQDAQTSSFLNVLTDTFTVGEGEGATEHVGFYNKSFNRYIETLDNLAKEIYSQIDRMSSKQFDSQWQSLENMIENNAAYKWSVSSKNINSPIYVYYTYLENAYPDQYAGQLIE